MSTAEIVAAHGLRKEHELVQRLRGEGALAPTAATALEVKRGLGRFVLRGLIRHGAVMQTEGGLYWLDEAAYARMRERRRRIAFWMVVVSLALAGMTIAAIVAFGPPRSWF